MTDADLASHIEALEARGDGHIVTRSALSRAYVEVAYRAQEMSRTTDDLLVKVQHLGAAVANYSAAARTARTTGDYRRHLDNARGVNKAIATLLASVS